MKIVEPVYCAVFKEEGDVLKVHQSAPDAKIISVYMEAVDHWALSKHELKNYTEEKGMSDNLLVPEDGEQYSF